MRWLGFGGWVAMEGFCLPKLGSIELGSRMQLRRRPPNTTVIICDSFALCSPLPPQLSQLSMFSQHAAHVPSNEKWTVSNNQIAFSRRRLKCCPRPFQECAHAAAQNLFASAVPAPSHVSFIFNPTHFRNRTPFACLSTFIP